MKNSFAHILNKLWYVIAAVLILAALLVSIARLLTPLLNDHRTDFEKIASNILNMPVMIHEVQVTWHGYAPEISLSDVTILDPETQKPKLVMQRFDVDFSIWRSVWMQKAFVQSITVSGVELEINHDASGAIQVGDLTTVNLKDSLTGASVEADKVAAWVFSQPRLALEEIHLHYMGPLAERSVTLKKLSLQNTQTRHILNGKAVLNQDLPTKVDVHLTWDGDVRKWKDAKIHLYLYFEGLSLPQWFSKQKWHGLNIMQGLASAKVWIHWNQAKIERFQSEFEVYGLTLYSQPQKRLEIINRASGVLGWMREGDHQTFVGDKILLDFPDHLWPITNFSIKGQVPNQGAAVVQNVQFSYANLADVRRLLLDTDFLPVEQRQVLTQLKARGEIADVQAVLPADLTDIQHLTLAGKWANFSVEAFKQYPAINNFSGGLSWNGASADITIASKKLAVTASQIFVDTLAFDNLNANVKLTHNSDGAWLLSTLNLHLDNPDVALDTKMVLTLPSASTPVIDLEANFKVPHAGKIASYLPVKILDLDLAHWLQAAFVSGHLGMGKIIVQGNFKDFPFDSTPPIGKFLVSTALQDMEFNYGPGWPHIRHLNGQLTFAGSAMHVEVASGMILNIPISDVKGVIPFIGAAGPQILHVDGNMQGDMASGLNFIQQSPLQTTIGKDLSALKLTGPMQLKLSLIVPLGKPDNTTVNGDVTVSSAKLMLPDWGLSLDNLNGSFVFTEAGIESKSIQGQFFGEPVSLAMTTLHNGGKIGQIRADLASKISISVLQNWLGMRFNDVLSGATPFQLQLYLSPHTDKNPSATRLVMNSTLQGVAVNLPRPYKKEASEAKDLQVQMNLDGGKLVKIQLSYAKLLNAALALQKSKQGFQLFGGEIHLGVEEPVFEETAGILVTGNVAKLNVGEWQDYFNSLQKNNKAAPSFDMKILRGVNLHADLIDLLGTELHRANLQVTPKNNLWQIYVDSTEINGNVTVPFKWDQQPVQGHFKYLHVAPMASKNKEETQHIDVRSVPALSLDIEDVSYSDMHFGHLYLDLAPSKSGLQIRQLRIDQPTLQLNATGEWTQSGKKNNSHLQGEMNAPHIGAVLTQWGINSSNLVGSTGNVKFDLSWPDAPYLPSVATMSGNLSLKLGEGRIVHLSESTNSKMGLGRLLNVLSLSSIPRRLSLNFSDLFEQGYSFDTMQSDFSFKNGSAYINKMRFEGPVAGVNLKGRIGMVAKDFDLQLGVTPHVTGSLPVVAAIAGGPVVGVATWLVDRVVSSQVSKSSRSEYTVTGSWENPVWKKRGANGESVAP